GGPPGGSPLAALAPFVFLASLTPSGRLPRDPPAAHGCRIRRTTIPDDLGGRVCPRAPRRRRTAPPEVLTPGVEAGPGARRTPARAAPPLRNPFPHPFRERVRRARPARDPLADSSSARRPTASFPTDG
ncbi:hypothetical protein PYK79_56980, partial [Streptomyces sp. ID05-04B]|nr:hypothetical protein [Streptomyces sp. ID05-04B]